MSRLLQKGTKDLLDEFEQVRKDTMELFEPLGIEDAVIQSDTFGSPPNWHIAHVTWFFQKVLEKHGAGLADSNVNLTYLNSYYQKYGEILPKSDRGKYPRPTVAQNLRYRAIIENKVVSLIKDATKSSGLSSELSYDINLGIQHEMQHQELMAYDFQHYYQRFPDPDDNYLPKTRNTPPKSRERPQGMVDVPGGIFELGFSGDGFCYDNELPEHKVYLQPFKIDIAPVTNGEIARFIEDGGYQEYKYWLADGWDLVREQGWAAPLYWQKNDGRWAKKDLRGLHELDPDEPVVNLSYYEAEAYARWAGKRLPTEAEWEKAASWSDDLGRKTLYPWGDSPPTPRHANLLDSYTWGPARIGAYPQGKSHYGCHQMLGDVWEWTSSEYVLYPGFMSKFPEYTDKWAVNQKVLRGGCFVTRARQIRNSYRNYFKPHERILFAGFRCASG
ncbi:ergothioneine biosynthesis protein EgtB [Nitrososphaera sp.]|uniref:ergothioneine biosynthesis protein EgtB n=1 Tax=Nitrososphaera sp. TaxID=1971748 RepID=UPI002ED975CE